MVSRRRAQDDLVEIVRRVRARVDAPISALLSPTFVDRAGLVAIREAGVDRVGVAVDAATPELFDELRGAGVFGPHGWQRYWEGIGEAVEVFGDGMAGCHLIVGLGETERQMVEALGRVRSLGAVTHLFSFYPEPGSALEQEQQPPVGQYRRMQLARYLVDTGLGSAEAMEFESSGRLLGFGVDDATLSRVVACGEPFETSGCPGADGRVACNRPFANTRPGPEIRNFPFPLEEADLLRVREELWS
jgi:biotin synthase